MPKINIIQNRCKGCLLCIPVCPHDAIEVSKELNDYGIHIAAFKIDGKCSACTNCAIVCPDLAIEVFKD